MYAASAKVRKPVSNKRKIILMYVMGWSVGIGMLLHWWGGTVSADSINTTYKVHAGDTLWSVASSHVKGEDTRQAVQGLLQLNHLADARIYPGQTLLIPSK